MTIKNKNNKGELNSKYRGVINSKECYIIFADSIDIILKKIQKNIIIAKK